MTMWPQVLMAVFLCIPVISGWVEHGKIKDRPINGYNNTLVTLWIALVLGMGGFWSIK